MAFAIALVTAPAGLSGAVLLLPFQMSVLGFASPGVAPTNLIYNAVAIPGGVYRYTRERRMAWPLAAVIIAGTVPGMFAGALIRIRYLPDPRAAKLFAACVLLYTGIRLLWDAQKGRLRPGLRRLAAVPASSPVTITHISAGSIEYEFGPDRFSFRPSVVLLLALVVGLVGGVYGIGGGAIIAPYIIGILRLPAYSVAGATLCATFVTSIAGIVIFEMLSRTPLAAGLAVRPDWTLGILFGAGGLLGSYFGARLQKYVPERWIRLFLAVLVAALASAAIWQYFQ